MQKIIIASHRKLASGLKDTLEYLAPNTVEIIDTSAYLDNVPFKLEVEKVLKQFEKTEQIFVFTDLLGGSVNQEFANKISEYNIELISGVNLPILLTLVLNMDGKEITADTIRQAIEEAKEQIVYVNDSLSNQEIDEEDE
ncbi:PTS N-acetylglucosamine transporter subunit IIBC [Tetragenococcus koreensis]|uniref:PTS sugar transporter subunit IIA n=1 Tax=Tetragenococcus koreensis TaxID=290335 RepID=UPI000F4F8E3F|nr:PTS N-acetylglucosamine transporter subunit IIBC [Tetragenococcus koreensis]AYW46536.1 PTS N-acetylglucosamine transporter subunit IIBC [Tetragenococcus koreensis]MCF1585360.1 PTS N-acetylglucosamine transporter subunit IIBC [Tetragenococcus koreensis]MCF1619736.1 PTS N-acetylglucosamine transporter subunit IIBC [Tetragenococcus koreensis]MCF1629587.1 PTS N-acetylglucosamine transporter subunit IIBC [Tetragenococcus koreensis]MCF1657219.1 PTS N-acetylglucosamine transporter subunit IIBC [Te